jgi:hypothetical protein
MDATSAARLSADSYEEAVELCFRNGWTDGMPVIPPTEDRVARFVAAAGRDPQEMLGVYRERSRRVTVEKVAANAVMAGCLPEYMPVVLAIAEVLLDPKLDFHPANASTGSPALGFIVNGPVRNQIGMNCRGNVFGPGNRANSTIGRAIRLLQINAFGSTPGAGNDDTSAIDILDRGTLGQPAKYAGYHIPEYEEAYPALHPLHVERGFAPEQNVVTVFATAGGMQISLHAEQTAEELADTLAYQLAHLGRHNDMGWLVLVLTPEAVRLLDRDGWSKARFRAALYAKAARSIAWLKQNNWPAMGAAGFYLGARGNAPLQPDDEHKTMSLAGQPDDIHLVVAGGPAGSWGYFLVPYGALASKAF